MKYKRFLGYGTLALTLISLGLAFARPISSSNLLIRARADLSNLSVTFNNQSTVESGSIQSSSCVLSNGLQMSGIKAYATISNTSNPQWSEISRFNNDAASIVFSVASPATSFRSLKSIAFTYRNTSYSGSMNIMWSSDNSSWTTISASCGVASQTLPSGAHYVKVVNNGGYAYFTAFTLNYSCSDEPEVKTLSSISVSGQTTEFTVGDTFSFGGTVTAHYSDSSSSNVTSSATFSGYNLNEEGEQTVTVSYTEDAVTKTTSYSITVSGGVTPQSLSGSYSVSISSYTAYIDFDNNKYYTDNYNYCFFTYTFDGSSITFSLDGSVEGLTGTTRRLFNSAGLSNTASYNSSTDKITVSLFYTFGSERSASYTFSKV